MKKPSYKQLVSTLKELQRFFESEGQGYEWCDRNLGEEIKELLDSHNIKSDYYSYQVEVN